MLIFIKLMNLLNVFVNSLYVFSLITNLLYPSEENLLFQEFLNIKIRKYK